VELRYHDHPLDGTQLVVGRVGGTGMVASTCIPKGFMHCRDHFFSPILSLIESYLALSYVLP